MIAKLIGESSAGMTAVEIYDDSGNLVWSREWFKSGCTRDEYIAGLYDALNCMRNCADYKDFNGGDVDTDGRPILLDDQITTGMMLMFNPESGWALGENARAFGQSREIIDACMMMGWLPEDDDMDRYDADVPAIVDLIKHQGR